MLVDSPTLLKDLALVDQRFGCAVMPLAFMSLEVAANRLVN